MTDTTPPATSGRPDQPPTASPAIRAQNPDLDTAWSTIAWWEQTCLYWRAEAEKGYALRDTLDTAATTQPEDKPEREWSLRAENGATIRTDAETARNAMTKGTYSIDGSPIVAALTRTTPDDEWTETDPTIPATLRAKPWSTDLHAVTLIRDVAGIDGPTALTVWNALAPLLGHIEREARIDERAKVAATAISDTSPRTT